MHPSHGTPAIPDTKYVELDPTVGRRPVLTVQFRAMIFRPTKYIKNKTKNTKYKGDGAQTKKE